MRLEVLHIDDNLGDLYLAHAAFADCCPSVAYHGAADAVEAMAALALRATLQQPLPQLVVLDLNMPRARGQDVLRFLQHHDLLKHLPVVVLSTSMLESEAIECRRLGASEVLHKPDTYEALVVLAHAMLRHATCPEPQPTAPTLITPPPSPG